ncbi:HEAT repeat domain-containing protein [bacterium]
MKKILINFLIISILFQQFAFCKTASPISNDNSKLSLISFFSNAKDKKIMEYSIDSYRKMKITKSELKAVIKYVNNKTGKKLKMDWSSTKGVVKISNVCEDNSSKQYEQLIALLSSNNIYEKIRAAQTLGKMGGEAAKAVIYIIELLTDTNEHVRAAGIKSLGELDAKEAVWDVMRLLSDESVYVRLACIDTLAKIAVKGDKKLKNSLVKLLDCQNDEVKKAALKALGKIGDKNIFKNLVNFLNFNYKNSDLTMIAIEAIGELGEKMGVKPLINYLLSIQHMHQSTEQIKKESEKQKRSIAYALVKIAANLQDEKILLEILPILVNLLNDEEHELRQAVMYSLNNMLSKNVKGVREYLIAKLEDEKEEVSNRVKILTILDKFIEKDKLLGLLHNRDENIRKRAAIRLALSDEDKEVIKYLIQLLQQNIRHEPRKTAMEALKRMCSEHAMNEVKKLFDESKDEDIKRTAISLFSTIGRSMNYSEKLAEDFKKIILNKNYSINIRKAGIDELFMCDENDIISNVIKLCQDGENEQKESILTSDTSQPVLIHLIEKFNEKPNIGEKVIYILFDLLKNKNKNIKIATMQALEVILKNKKLSSEGNPLILFLTDNDTDIKLAAIRALGKIGDKTVIKPLMKLLCGKNNQNEKDDIKTTVVEALGSIGEDYNDSVKCLIKLLTHRDATVRIAAVKALSAIDGNNQKVLDNLLCRLKKDMDDKVKAAVVEELAKETIIIPAHRKSEIALTVLTLHVRKLIDDKTAAKLLVRLENQDAIPILLGLLMIDEEASMALEGLKKIIKGDDKKVIDAFIDFLNQKNNNPLLKCTIMDMLAQKFSGNKKIPFIFERLMFEVTEDIVVRDKAVLLLSKMELTDESIWSDLMQKYSELEEDEYLKRKIENILLADGFEGINDINALIKLLDSDMCREQVISRLMKMWKDREIDLEILMLKQIQCPYLDLSQKIVCIDILAKVGGKKTLDFFLQQLQLPGIEQPYWLYYNKAIIEALSKIIRHITEQNWVSSQHDEENERLIQNIKNVLYDLFSHRNVEIRLSSVQAYAKIRTDKKINTKLVEMLFAKKNQEHDLYLRLAIIQTLPNSIILEEKVKASIKKELSELLGKKHRHSSPYVRLLTLKLLMRINDYSEDYLGIALKDTDPLITEKAISYCLSWTGCAGERKGIDYLINLLKDNKEEFQLRKEIASLLGRRDDAFASGIFIDLLMQGKEDLKQLAQIGLEKMTNVPIDKLLEIITTSQELENIEVKIIAANILNKRIINKVSDKVNLTKQQIEPVLNFLQEIMEKSKKESKNNSEKNLHVDLIKALSKFLANAQVQEAALPLLKAYVKAPNGHRVIYMNALSELGTLAVSSIIRCLDFSNQVSLVKALIKLTKKIAEIDVEDVFKGIDNFKLITMLKFEYLDLFSKKELKNRQNLVVDILKNELMNPNTDKRIQGNIVDILVDIQGSKNIDFFIGGLRGKYGLDIIPKLIITLGDLRAQKAVAELASLHLRNELYRLRNFEGKGIFLKNIIEALAKIGNKGAIEFITYLCKYHTVVKKDDILMRKLNEVLEPKDITDINQCINMLYSDELRDKAKDALINIGGKEVTDALIKMFLKGELQQNKHIKKAVLEILGAVGTTTMFNGLENSSIEKKEIDDINARCKARAHSYKDVAKKFEKEGNLIYAIINYQSALEINPESKEAKNAFDSIIKGAKNRLKSEKYDKKNKIITRKGFEMLQQDIKIINKYPNNCKDFVINKKLLEKCEGRVQVWEQGDFSYEKRQYLDVVVVMKFEKAEKKLIDIQMVERAVIVMEEIEDIIGTNPIIKIVKEAKLKIQDYMEYLRTIYIPICTLGTDIISLLEPYRNRRTNSIIIYSHHIQTFKGIFTAV